MDVHMIRRLQPESPEPSMKFETWVRKRVQATSRYETFRNFQEKEAKACGVPAGEFHVACRFEQVFGDDKAIAEDVVHDVFVSFLSVVEKFELRSSLAGFLKTCVANRARNYAKKKQHQTVTVNKDEQLISKDNEIKQHFFCKFFFLLNQQIRFRSPFPRPYSNISCRQPSPR